MVNENGSAISLNGVSFSYPGGRKVLEDVEMHISRGEKVGLCGSIGSGKIASMAFVSIASGSGGTFSRNLRRNHWQRDNSQSQNRSLYSTSYVLSCCPAINTAIVVRTARVTIIWHCTCTAARCSTRSSCQRVHLTSARRNSPFVQ